MCQLECQAWEVDSLDKKHILADTSPVSAKLRKDIGGKFFYTLVTGGGLWKGVPKGRSAKPLPRTVPAETDPDLSSTKGQK